MKYEKRGFFPRTEIEWIVNEFDRIKWHAVKFTEMMAEPVIENVDNEIELIIDDNAAPFVSDTMGNLKKTAQKIADKYKTDLSDDGKRLYHIADRILRDDCDPCGESIYCALFRYDFNPENTELIKDVEKLKKEILNAHHGYKVGGIYDHKTKTITLFSQNLNGKEEYILAFAQSFFTAVYRYLLDANGSTEKLDRYYHEVVIGSLSECFKIHYVNEFSWDFSVTPQELVDSFKDKSPIFDPYCRGAKLFTERFGEYGTNYLKILEESYFDFRDALKKMVIDYDYDIIIRKEKQTRITGLPSKMSPYSGGRNSKTAGTKRRGNVHFHYLWKDNIHQIEDGCIEEYHSDNDPDIYINNVRRGDVIFNLINEMTAGGREYYILDSVSIATEDAVCKNNIWYLYIDTHKIKNELHYYQSEYSSTSVLLSELIKLNPKDGFLIYLEKTIRD